MLSCRSGRVEGSRHFGLFHIESDPNCLKEVGEDHPEVVTTMRRALERWIDEQVETSIEEIFPGGERALNP